MCLKMLVVYCNEKCVNFVTNLRCCVVFPHEDDSVKTLLYVTYVFPIVAENCFLIDTLAVEVRDGQESSEIR